MGLQVTALMKQALSEMSDSAFQGAAATLSFSDASIREALQQKTSVKIQEIINKLSGSADVSAEESALMEAWIVGDSNSYVQSENNLNEWVEEYKRLVGVLESYENRDCSEDDLLKVRGILADAVRVSYDISNLLEKKERIAKFRLAISDGLDGEERAVLVRVLTGKLRSPEC